MGIPKYKTEEERKAAQREYNKQYYQNNKEKLAKQKAEWRKNNKEKYVEYQAEWRKNNKEKKAKCQAEWRQNNKEKYAEYDVKYRLTLKGRANNLLKAYRVADKKQNRGECTLTAEWIVKNIFSQPCHYCGKTDWTKMGCDRIDNSLPHTPENVVPCCAECNRKKARYSYDEYMRLIGKIA